MEQILGDSFPIWLVAIILIWSTAWKGIALWKAAQIGDKRWFIAILVLNTLGILDILYIRFVASKYSVETVESK